MATSTRKSPALIKAEGRLKGMQSLAQSFTASNEFSLRSYELAVQSLSQKLADYNEMVDDLNRARKDIGMAEAALNDMSEHMLLSVAATFGKNSQEYVTAGGIQKSSIRRGPRTAKSTPVESKLGRKKRTESLPNAAN
jgi:hypothetical protein